MREPLAVQARQRDTAAKSARRPPISVTDLFVGQGTLLSAPPRRAAPATLSPRLQLQYSTTLQTLFTIDIESGPLYYLTSGPADLRTVRSAPAARARVVKVLSRTI